MLLKLYRVAYDVDSGRKLVEDGWASVLSLKLNKSMRPINGAEAVAVDGYVFGGDLCSGDIFEYGKNYYEVVDVSAGMSGLKRYYIKIYGG